MPEPQLDIDMIEQYAQMLGHYIHESISCTQHLRDVKASLDELRNAKENKYLFELRQLREDFNILIKHLEKFGVPGPDLDVEKLARLKPLLDDPEWPIAVHPDSLVKTDEGKQVRAKQILDLVVTESLAGLKFLDYGCGEGCITSEACQRKPSMVIGYDIEKQWDDKCTNMTTDYKVVSAKAPYDIVLLYDVLDHCKNPIEELVKIRDVLSLRGRVYVRMHPWCGKHGGHLYKTINKAYAHVIFDDAEQMQLFGVSNPFVHKLVNPVLTYRNWFMISGFNVLQESIIRDNELNPFFTDIDNIHVQERIASHWKGLDYRKDLTLNFVNYQLEANPSHKQIL